MLTKNRMRSLIFSGLLLLTISGCRKAEYAKIDSPAYLKVFNCLTKDDDVNPFVTMLIDPILDEDGVPVSAEIVGDFLDHRSQWARPFPDAGNSALYQDQYPGSLKILAAPILNGYDLSTWAQIPSGKHRVIFCSRTYNQTPFFELGKNLRDEIYADTTIDFNANEVYTMNLLLKDVTTKKKFVYLRKEDFHKNPLSDSLVYVNFYNLSAIGSYEKVVEENKYLQSSDRKAEVPYDFSAWLTLRKPYLQSENVYRNRTIVGYDLIPFAEVKHSFETSVNPYHSFPLFPVNNGNAFTGDMQQTIAFLPASITKENIIPPSSQGSPPGNAYFEFVLGTTASYFGDQLYYGRLADPRTGLILSIPSGKDKLKSFATVNTIEFINGSYYLSTVQRRFDPPTY